MTVAELIALLQNQPGNTRVFVRGYEDGINDIDKLEEIKVKLNAYTSWYYGQHERVIWNEDPYDFVGLELVGTNKLTKE